MKKNNQLWVVTTPKASEDELPNTISQASSAPINPNQTNLLQIHNMEPSGSTQDNIDLEKVTTAPRISPIFMILTDPKYSIAAKIFYAFDIGMVLWSIISFILQSDIQINTMNTVSTFFAMETVVTCYFLGETLLRYYVCPNRKMFFRSIYNVLDILSIIPYFIILLTIAASGQDLYSGTVGTSSETNAFFKVMKMLRILRLVRLLKHNESMNVMFHAFKISGDGMMMLIVIYGISIILFSSLVFHAETTICQLGSYSQVDPVTGIAQNQTMLLFHENPNPEKNGTPCTYQSIVDAFWWAIVTICTVGYGDTVPDSKAGRAAAGLTMISGVFLLGFPVSVFSANFTEIYTKHKIDVEKKRVRRMTVKALHRRATRNDPMSPISEMSIEHETNPSSRMHGFGKKVLRSLSFHSGPPSPAPILRIQPPALPTQFSNTHHAQSIPSIALNHPPAISFADASRDAEQNRSLDRSSGEPDPTPAQVDLLRPFTPNSLGRRVSSSSSNSINKEIVKQLQRQMIQYQSTLKDLHTRLETLNEQGKLMAELVDTIAMGNTSMDRN